MRGALQAAIAHSSLCLVTTQQFDYYRMMKTNDALAALAALAQDSRLAVFRLLVQAGPAGMAATKIAESLAIGPTSLSFHLKELTHAQMITSVKYGRSIIYSANFATMNGLLGFLTENCCGGNPCSVDGAVDCTAARPTGSYPSIGTQPATLESP